MIHEALRGEMLRGERVILRPVEPRDLDAFIALFSAAGMERFWPGEDREKLAREHVWPDDDDVTVYAVTVNGATWSAVPRGPPNRAASPSWSAAAGTTPVGSAVTWN